EMRDTGNTAEEILKELTSLRQRIHTSFVIDTMEYLYMGGRCTAMQNLVGSILKIRPVIEVRKDGTLGVKDKVGGSRKKALNNMLEDFRKNADNLDTHRVFVTHTGCDDDAQYLKEEILKIKPVDELLTTITGATVSSHCGPNTIGIIYITR
ncbi:MAG: DegV family EDD domain-containing protein, partial [Anaerolineaceae bacterium]|nr:DegV family EDD domain-containing protein [Anaerolineaceae bacterium]